MARGRREETQKKRGKRPVRSEAALALGQISGSTKERQKERGREIEAREDVVF